MKYKVIAFDFLAAFIEYVQSLCPGKQQQWRVCIYVCTCTHLYQIVRILFDLEFCCCFDEVTIGLGNFTSIWPTTILLRLTGKIAITYCINFQW